MPCFFFFFFCASDLRAWLEPDGNASRPLTNHCWAPFVRVYFDLTCLSGAQKELPYSPNALQTNWQPLYSHTSLPQVGLGKKRLTSLNTLLLQSIFMSMFWSMLTIYVTFLFFCQRALNTASHHHVHRLFSRTLEREIYGMILRCWPHRLITPFPFHSLWDVRSAGLISVVQTRPIYLSGSNMPKDTFICFELILMQHP